MYETTATSKAVRLRRSAARKARVALATALVAAGLVVPPLAAGLVAPPAHAATTTNPPIFVNFNGDLSDLDPNDGVCDASAGNDQPCTLRAAIQVANARSGPDEIDFAVTETFRDPATGVVTIAPHSILPTLTDRVTINGYSQQGAHPNTLTVGDDAALKIQLLGTNVPGVAALRIEDSSNSVIRGLAINRFGRGVEVRGASVGNRIEGNFIGTDATGTQLPSNSSDGVFITSGGAQTGPSQTVVGGSTPDKRNVISGNDGQGIAISGSDGNVVRGNYVGTDKSGTIDFGNQGVGVDIDAASGTTVGGTTAASRNLISGNNGTGLDVFFSQNTKVLGNRIGTNASGAGALGNLAAGVFISASASGTLVGDGSAEGSNIISFNGQDGVHVQDSGSSSEISRNSIFSNGGLGIDLIGPAETTTTDVSNANDPGDVDPGPNGLQNKPSIGSAKTVSGTTTIKGTLSSEAGKSYKIEFYSNPSGTNEGKKFIGMKSVTTGADGKAVFTFTPAAAVSGGQAITATATNATSGSPHDTSEFSVPRTVTSA